MFSSAVNILSMTDWTSPSLSALTISSHSTKVVSVRFRTLFLNLSSRSLKYPVISSYETFIGGVTLNALSALISLTAFLLSIVQLLQYSRTRWKIPFVNTYSLTPDGGYVVIHNDTRLSVSILPVFVCLTSMLLLLPTGLHADCR